MTRPWPAGAVLGQGTDAGTGGRRWSPGPRLMAVYYLITGSCYQPVVESGRIWMQHWCPALRERYHAAACGAMNYLRAADGTTDPCLSRLLTELGEDEYRQGGPAAGSAGAGNAAGMSETGRGDCPALCFVL